MWIIAGLGNPGGKYELTRHNVGFLVADDLLGDEADRLKKGFNSFYGTIKVGREEALVLKPQTFMNLSGQAVQAAMTFYKIKASNLIVIHDEIDLPFLDIRSKFGGGHAGHNGLRDIISRIGQEFHRIRVGIGRPDAKMDVSSFVLSKFYDEELTMLSQKFSSIKSAVFAIINK